MRIAIVMLLCTFLAGCAGGMRRGSKSLPDEQLGPLVELVPPGPSWLVQARPNLLAQQDATRMLWRALVTEEREQAFVERTGVDPLAVQELVAFELPPQGYVLLVRGPFDAEDIVARAGERLALEDVATDGPVMRREGLAGQGRYAYAALAEHTFLVAKEAPPSLIASILALREDRGAHKQPRALDGADSRSLSAEHAANPFVLFAPKPLDLAPGTPVSLLFARERALAVAVRPTHSVLPISIDMRGEFPPGAEHNLRALARSLASAQLGHALGLMRVPETMAIRVDAQGAFVTFALEARDLVAGMRMLFFDELRQLLG
jgi:hypothetical protein